MSNSRLTFRDGFPPVARSTWRETVDRDLAGVPFDRKLVRRLPGGVEVQPHYTSEDWNPAGDPSGFPGFPPFTRGSTALVNALRGWDIRQCYDIPDLGEARAAIADDVRHGVSSLHVVLDRLAREGLDPDDGARESASVAERGERRRRSEAPTTGLETHGEGLLAYCLGDLQHVLDGLPLACFPVSIDGGAAFIPAAAMLAAVWERTEGLDGRQVRGAFNADPLSDFARQGMLPVPVEVALAAVAELTAWTAATWPLVTAVTVSTSVYHDAGCDAVQELAFSMASAVEYLRAMEHHAGLEITTAARQMQFEFSTDCRFFLEIAKLRAARRLWYRVVEASGGTPDSARMRMHVRTGRRIQTARDPWVNMLRNTAACFAASVAGAQSIATEPFDAALGQPDAFSRRIARNTQIVLNEESHLGRVIDPAGGSHFIERLTEDLASKAWALFQEIERAGGMVAGLRSGDIAKRVNASYEKRAADFATRKEALTGVTEFANVQERAIDKQPVNLDALRRNAAVRLQHEQERARRQAGGGSGGSASGLTSREALERVRQAARSAFTEPGERGPQRDPGPGRPGIMLNAATEAMIAGASVGEVFAAAYGEFMRADSLPAPIASRPFAAPFEALRAAADRAALGPGGRPRVFLANMGPIAQHTARATFSRNFMEVGGYEVITNNGFEDATAAAEAFRASGAKTAVICSSDALYPQFVPEVARALKQAGARTVVLAGGFGDHEEAWRSAGVDRNIFLKCNVYEILRDLLAAEGVEVE